MRLDSHQHFWRYDAAAYDWIDEQMGVLRRDFVPADLLPLLQRTGRSGCIAVQARADVAETEWLLRLAAEAPFVRGVVGWVDLLATDVEAQLDRFAGTRLVSVRHGLQSEPDAFSEQPAFRRGLRAVAARGLCYDLLVKAPQLPAVIELVSALPQATFVLDHFGKPRVAAKEHASWARDLRALAAFPNVACKVSGLVTEAMWSDWNEGLLQPYFDTALSAFTPARLMFGSDWPVCLCAASYERWSEVVAGFVAPLSASEQAAIDGGTAARWYRLDGR
ncbi:MAG: amidohydrolase family protein [Planctomycetota bacterium]